MALLYPQLASTTVLRGGFLSSYEDIQKPEDYISQPWEGFSLPVCSLVKSLTNAVDQLPHGSEGHGVQGNSCAMVLNIPSSATAT